MYRRFHDRFGTAGVVIGVIALIVALGGSAFAASGGLNPKQKKQVIKIAKKYAGQDGAPGATGPAGPAGANGTNGTDGADGKNLVTGTEAPGANCTEGGIWTEVEGSGTKKYVCDGEEGPQGEPGAIHPGETLPEGASETGAWSVGNVAKSATAGFGAYASAPLSFTIPLAAPLAYHSKEEEENGEGANQAHFILANGEEVRLNSSFELEEEAQTACPGTAAAPTAEPGNLCVYEGYVASGTATGKAAMSSMTITRPAAPFSEQGAGTSGAIVSIFFATSASNTYFGMGTWAVTAE